ncbi:MAG: HEPN domain-containing protein [Candidatus Hydrothermarchaeales archaeon]
MLKYSELHLKKASEFISAAEHDFQDGFYNAAVSHAYYAMHHSARALLLLINESPKTHSGVINVLWQNIEKLHLSKEEIRALSRVFDRRIKSDYGVGLEPPSEEATGEIVEEAKKFLDDSIEIVENWK